MRILLTLIGLFHFSSITYAGCPAIRIQRGQTKVLKCAYQSSPDGAVMDVSLSYSNEPWSAKGSGKNEKVRIFQAKADKDSCEKTKVGKNYCMELDRWCVMSGAAPHGASYTVSSVKEGQCPPPSNAKDLPMDLAPLKKNN